MYKIIRNLKEVIEIDSWWGTVAYAEVVCRICEITLDTNKNLYWLQIKKGQDLCIGFCSEECMNISILQRLFPNNV